jgi:type I restriction enzyme M protein
VLRKAGLTFYNTSPLDMGKLMGDQDHIREPGRYIQGFSPDVRDIFERFDFAPRSSGCQGRPAVPGDREVRRHRPAPLARGQRQMGLVFEELIRKFAELSNETAGEHFTPREVIRLMVNLLFIEDDDALTKPGVVRTIYDPTAGTGGMLSVAGEYLPS